MKNLFKLIVAMAAALIILTMSWAVYKEGVRLEEESQKKEQLTMPRSTSIHVQGRKYPYKIYTIEHDGHMFILYSNGGAMMHHPDCNCLKKVSE